MPLPQPPTARRRGRPPKQVVSPTPPTTAEEPVAAPAAAVAEKPAAPTPPTTVVKPAQMFHAVRAPIYHPYQNVLIPVGRAVPLFLDNWVEVQLAAKVIEPA